MRRPIASKQLIAIAKAVIIAAPAIDDAEWKERTKCRLVNQGWAYPTPEQLSNALTRVEHALERRWGRRQ